jgi:hypothetical protein
MVVKIHIFGVVKRLGKFEPIYWPDQQKILEN